MKISFMSNSHKVMNIYFGKVWNFIDSVITVLSYGRLAMTFCQGPSAQFVDGVHNASQ